MGRRKKQVNDSDFQGKDKPRGYTQNIQPEKEKGPEPGFEDPTKLIPAVHYKPNPKDSGWTQTKKQLFIKNLPKFGTFSKTAEVINISRHTAESWRRKDEEFDRAVAECDVVITEQLVRTAMYRGLNGSDNLLMFLIKARDSKYRERMVQELDEGGVNYMVSKFIAVVEKVVPKMCPNCRTNMDLPNKISKELLLLSEGLVKK